jgi:MFS family permease
MSEASAQEKHSGHDVPSDDERKKQSSETTSVAAAGQTATPGKSPQEQRRETLKAWKRVAGAWLLFFIAWGPALAYGSFETYYRTELLPDYSSSQLAWIGALSTLLLVCAGAFAGPLFDRGYLRTVLVCGCIVLVFSLEMLSLCTEYYQIILAQGLGYGLGSGLIYVPALAFVTASFPPKTRAYAVGVLTTGAGFAGVVYPIMFIRLVPEIGFGWAMRFWGFLSLFLAVIALILVWDAPTKTTRPRSLVDWSAFTEYPFVTLCLTGFCQFLGYWYVGFARASFIPR